MNFAHPKVIWISAILLPLLGLFLWATWRKRQSLIREFVQHKVLAQQTLGVSFGRQKLRRLLLLVAVAFLLLTIAGPQWGFTWEEASQRGRDIIVAIDVSGVPKPNSKRPDPTAFEALFSSAFLFERTIIKEKLKSAQPDILISAGTSHYQVLDFLKFDDILAAAAPAKEKLKQQLTRVLSVETLPELTAPNVPPSDGIETPKRKRRGLLSRARRKS